MKNKYNYAYLFLLLCAFCSACNLKEQPVSAALAQQTAVNIERAVNEADQQYLGQLIEMNSFFRKMEQNTGIKLSRKEKNDLAKGLSNKGLGLDQLVGKDRKNCRFSFLRRYEKEGRQHLLFRAYLDGGINYYDFELVQFDNTVKAADIYVFTAGASMSTIIGLTMDNMKKSAVIPDGESIQRMKLLVNQKRSEEAYKLFLKLPPELQQQKVFKMMKVTITSGMGDNELYIKTMQDYRKEFPDDRSIPLLMIDAYFLEEDFEKALDAVNELDRMVGTDPLLNYYRGLCYYHMGDDAQSLSAMEKVYAYNPGFQDGAVELIAAYLGRKDYDKARPVIKAYRSNALFDQGKLEDYLATMAGLPTDIASRQ